MGEGGGARRLRRRQVEAVMAMGTKMDVNGMFKLSFGSLETGRMSLPASSRKNVAAETLLKALFILICYFFFHSFLRI